MSSLLQSQETTNELNAREVERIKGDIEALQIKFDKLIEERNKAMVWGLLSLGTVVMALAGFIASFLIKSPK